MLTADMLHLLRQMVRQPFDCYASFRWIENRQSAFSASGRVLFNEASSSVLITLQESEFCTELYLRQCSKRFVLSVIHNHFKVEISCEQTEIRPISGGFEILATDLLPLKQSDLRKYMRVKNIGDPDGAVAIDDISLGGLCIVDRRRHLNYRIGDQVEVSLELHYPRLKPKTISVIGVIRRSTERKLGTEFGLEFHPLKEDTLYWINTFIQSHLRAVANHESNSGLIRLLNHRKI